MYSTLNPKGSNPDSRRFPSSLAHRPSSPQPSVVRPPSSGPSSPALSPPTSDLRSCLFPLFYFLISVLSRPSSVLRPLFVPRPSAAVIPRPSFFRSSVVRHPSSGPCSSIVLAQRSSLVQAKRSSLVRAKRSSLGGLPAPCQSMGEFLHFPDPLD
jgi:hypothetical protein